MTRRIEIDTQERFDFNDNKPRSIADFLMTHYNIRMPLQDPEKIQITPKDETLWKYQPKDVLNEILLHLKSNGKNVTKSDLWSVIISPNYIEPYDPVKEYFDSIRGTYKGESHIDILCNHIKARTFDDNTPEYYQERANRLIKKWIVACVACWLGGQPNDVALGLISGRGGIGKTSLGKYIFPEPIQEYYTAASKDERLFNMTDAFTRYMFINFEELEGINKSTINTFKMLMSQSEILSRTYHEKIATNKKRLACVLFSTNHNQEHGGFIHASYGDTRRFGCIELDDIDWEGYPREVDVDQIWSEALNLYEDTDFKYVFDKETDFPDFIKYNQRYAYESTAMECIQRNLSVPENENEGEKLNATMILNKLIAMNKIKRDDLGPRDDKINIRTIGVALSALGFQNIVFRPKEGNNNPIYGWLVKFNE